MGETFIEEDRGQYDRVCPEQNCKNDGIHCPRGRGFDCFGEHFKNKGFTYRAGVRIIKKEMR